MTEEARLLPARCNCCTTTDFQASPVNRRAFLSGSTALAAFGGMIAIDLMAPLENATAQSLAGRQIRLIVPFPAGGPTDIVARPFAQMLGDGLKSIVVIDNRGGAGGSLGA